jgi:hypothetical protein
MATQSVTTALRDCTIKEKALNQNNNEETFDQTDFLSSPATIDAHGLYSGLVEPAEVDQENNNNNKTSSSKRKNQKDSKRLQTKSVLSSSENVSSGDTDATTLSRGSNVWKYATREAGTDFSICCLCADNKRISSNNGSTSTLRKHLISVHNLHHLALPTKKNESTKSSISLNKKRELDNLLVNCVVKDGRTFNDLQKSGLKKVLHELVPGTFISTNI